MESGLGHDLIVEEYLYEYMEQNQRWYEIWGYDDFVEINVEWGDWKHDHIALDYLMEQVGFTCVNEELTEENGSDCYSAIHKFVLQDKEKIDYEKHEVIMGQDHCYWVYSNETDKYYETSVSWNKYDENDFVEKFNTVGFKLYGNNWIDEPDFDI